MVDAAVGGKTGINTAEGKNLVGAFHPPAGVLCDLAALETLPRNDLVAGLAEVVKCGFIADPAILDLVEADPTAATRPGGAALRELVERAVAVKAEVVTAGPPRVRPARDPQLRAHPRARGRAGRALPVAARRRGQRRHGLRGRAGPARRPPADEAVATATARARSLGLPTTYRQDRWQQLLDAMRRDKKTRGDLLRFVVLDDLARPGRLEGPDPALLSAAYAELAPD